MRDLTERAGRAKRVEAAKAAAPASNPTDSADARVKSEALTYEKGSKRSFFGDVARAQLRGDLGAMRRLEKHMEEQAVERLGERDAQFGGGRDPEQYDLSSTDSAGGYLVAPLYLQDEFIDLARAGRPFVNAVGTRELPANTDSINIPSLATGVTVDDQADNAAVSETDAAFGTVAADVKTNAGLQDVAQQVVDRSVPGVDEIIFADLLAAYNAKLDYQALNSTTSNNEGVLAADSTNTVTYTDASPTLAELYSKLADGVQKIHSNIFMPPDAFIMHPRRWAFALAASDSTGRPLIVPNAQLPQNASGTFEGVISEGPVGTIQGIPVFVDSQIPTTNGSGTNEDPIITARRRDLFIWEDPQGPYVDTFRDVLSGTLGVRFRLFNYWAQQMERRPKAITLTSGTGLAAPTF